MKIVVLIGLCFSVAISQTPIDEIIQKMTLEQKIGQTTQVDFVYLNDQDKKTDFTKIKTLSLGSVLVGGNGCPDQDGNISTESDCMDANNEAWKNVADKAKAQSVEVTVDLDEGAQEIYTIEPLLGTDAIRGNQHSVGEILFPHNIGLAATHNVENLKNAAKWARDSVLDSGFNFVFAPTVAVSHNPQWGRFYETLGTDPAKIKEYAKAYVEASQNIDVDGKIQGVLTSVKHFIGDGATFNGYEEGDSHVDDESLDTFIQQNVQGYIGAIEAKTGNIMISYDAINGVAMSIHPLVNDLLKKSIDDGGLGFEGFVISDYNSVIKTAEVALPRESEQIELDEAYALSFNIGVDMQMLAGGLDTYLPLIKQLVEDDKITEDRLNDAVKRILQVKDKMGLINIKGQQKEPKTIVRDKDQEYADALQATLESLVLLKNSNKALPKDPSKITNIILLGERIVPVKNGHYLFQDYDNIGAQNGGWTIRWQGYNGNDYWTGDLQAQSRATSLLSALKQKFPTANIYHPEYVDRTDFDKILDDRTAFRNKLIEKLEDFSPQNTLLITVLAENPYAEYMGDVNCVYCQTVDKTGCLYDYHDNEYQPQKQATSLEIRVPQYEKSIINLLKGKSNDIDSIMILFSGRPLIIKDPLSVSQAFIAAWLPGTTGGDALVQAIIGDYYFDGTSANTLPSPWIATMESIKDFPKYENQQIPEIEDPFKDAGFGLSTKPQTIE